MHTKIAKNISSRAISKTNFRDTIDYILKQYCYKTKQILLRDYITRTSILSIEKYKINENKNPIEYNSFSEEMKKTIAVMTGKTDLSAVEEVINYIKDVEKNEDEMKIFKNIDINKNEFADEYGINQEINVEKNKDLIKENSDNVFFENDDVIQYIDENEIKKEIEIITKEKEIYLKTLL